MMKSLETHYVEPQKSADDSDAQSADVPGEGSVDNSAREELGTRYVSSSSDQVPGRLPSGHLLQDRYRIRDVLGMGGMSVVYQAQDMRFSNVTRLCVVKQILNTATDPQARQMAVRNFEREANILATLSHPAIVQVYDYLTEGDSSYLVLEYVEGRDLEKILTETQGFLPESQVVQWAIQVCDVLSYLHNYEPPVIFRDLKPSNIMLDAHNRVRLIDFGIARHFKSGLKGTMIGTEGYSPPEQYRGVAEPRVDIYALGATIHHLLSKQDPRLEPPFSFHERPIHDTNPFVSRGLIDIISRALEYNINKRYGSAEEMRRALMTLGSARGSGNTTTFGAPAVTNGEVSALWRFACEDEVRSSPTFADGRIYVGAYDNNLYALEAENGEFVWKYATDGSIASTPFVFEGRVFFGSADKVLYAVNANSGRIIWTCPTQGSIWTSPQVAMGHVFFGSDDKQVYATNVQSGRVAWTFTAEGKVRSSPAIGDDTIYIGCEIGLAYCININGQARWRFRARRGITSSPALAEDMVYVGCQDRHVYGLDIRSGWSVWRYRTGAPVVSSPAYEDGLLFIGSADKSLYALDAESGHLVWRYETEGQVNSSPLVAEGAVYFGSVDGAVYSVDAQTGTLRWRFQTDGPVTSSPIFAEGIVYIGSHDRYVYALPA
jgi:outer membrane protein assembly factor BamB/tRNA A-37 threonylcarbamoyl transferase component Bud32